MGDTRLQDALAHRDFKNTLLYKRALCYKMAGRYRAADYSYFEHKREFRGAENRDLQVTMFGFLMVPSVENRR